MTVKTVASFMALVLVLVMGASGVVLGDVSVNVSQISPQDPARGYAVSSPPVAVAPNGDLVSNYPPYFRPNK